jgi:hypothetical protein
MSTVRLIACEHTLGGGPPNPPAWIPRGLPRYIYVLPDD